MNQDPSTKNRLSRRLTAGAAAIAILAAAGFGAVTAGTVPVLADAVRVEAPAAPGFADVVEKVSPAVVSVRVTAKLEPAADDGLSFNFNMPGFEDLPDDHPLKRFFREFRGERGPEFGPRGRRGGPSGPRPVSQGSGFFISGDGYLVTNNHVVEGGGAFTVVMDDGKELDAKLIGTDPRTDLAVLKVEGDRDFTYVAFADDAKVRVGDWVVAVGNPFGLGGTVTAGIVSARGRDIGAGPYDDFLQIDAAVNRGNSGGPAFNLSGEVVGINTAIFSPSGGNVGIAFAIPASVAKDVVNDLIDDGAVKRGWLGVSIQPVTPDIADSLGLDGTDGALVSDAPTDGPAHAAGIGAGDVIVSVNDNKIASPKELAKRIGSITPGTGVEIGLWRKGKTETVSVELGTLPGIEKRASLTEPDKKEADVVQGFGLTVAPAEDGEGVVVTNVDTEGEAASRGIQVGDTIVSVNSEPVSSADDIAETVKAATDAGRKAVLFQLRRDDANRFVALPVARG
ncbi:MAG: Do family serine endopeptidase [Rhizobiaceae bacterium]